MRLVCIESPYRADTTEGVQRHYNYRQLCISDSLDRGEAPFASHQMYTDALDDDAPTERDLGIRAGYAWWKHAAAIIFYIDYGMSPGMHKALQRAKTMQMATEMRKIL